MDAIMKTGDVGAWWRRLETRPEKGGDVSLEYETKLCYLEGTGVYGEAHLHV